MSRKKIVQEELYEEEKIIPAEENNCFAWKNKCTCLSNIKLSKQDKVNCGTLRCKFYKPIEHINSVRHDTKEGTYFESYEDYKKAGNFPYLLADEIKAYELMPHASEEDVDKMYEKFMKENPNLNLGKMKKTELFELGRELGLNVNSKMKKDELLTVLKEEGYA